MTLNNPQTFFVFFVLMWLGVSFLIAQLGGWAELSGYYRATKPFDGERWRFRSCRMRLNTRYNSSVTVGANQESLCLSVLPLFRAGHPPLQIPWREMSVRQGKTFWWRWTEFTFQQAPSVWLRFYGGLTDEIQNAAGASWPQANGVS